MGAHVPIPCARITARCVPRNGMRDHWPRNPRRDLRARSAARTPGCQVHPLAIEALAHAGIDPCALRRMRWGEFSADGVPPLAIVKTVYDSAAAETCPVSPGRAGS
jgi:arsenate reductase